MKKTKILSISIICMLFMFVGSSVFAQLQQDSKYGFRITIPNDWSKNSYMDGTDNVYDYMSPDENAAVKLRAFEAGADFTTDLLAQVYEESYLPAGTQKLSLEEYITVNGIPCKKGIYLLDYNGTEVGFSAIYIVQNDKGYVLTALIPSSMIEQKGEELKAVVNSFNIDGFSSPAASNSQSNSSGLGGTSSGSNNGKSFSGQYKYTQRSDGMKIMYYKTIDFNADGSYVFKMQGRGSDHVQTNVGKWTLNGDILKLQRNNSDVNYTYTVKDNYLYEYIDGGKYVFTFEKQGSNYGTTETGNQTSQTNSGNSSGNSVQLSKSSIQIDKLEIGNEVDSNHGVIESALLFPPNTARLNLVFDFSGNANEKLFLVKWYSNTHKCLITEAEYFSVDSDYSRGHAYIENNNMPWPNGEYRTEIWFDNQKIIEQKFTIGDQDAKQTPRSVLLGKIFSDGTGDNRTKGLGGKYLPVDLNKLTDNDILEVRITSGDLKFVHIHLRNSLGNWSSIYNGMETRFLVKDLMSNGRTGYTHFNFSVNGKHELYMGAACYAEVWLITEDTKVVVVEDTEPIQNSPPSGNYKQIILDNQNFGYDFVTGKLRNSHKPDPDVLNEPWCTDLPAFCGNWAKTGKSRMQDVTSAPSSGYISDSKTYTDCQECPLNEVLVFKLKDGTFAKLIIIKDEKSKVNDGCQHRITCLVEYPAFTSAQGNQQASSSQNSQSAGFWPHTARLTSSQVNSSENLPGFKRFYQYGELSFLVPETWSKTSQSGRTMWHNPQQDGGLITHLKMRSGTKFEDKINAESTKDFKNMGTKTIGGFECCIHQIKQIVGMQNNIQLRTDVVYVKTARGVHMITFQAKQQKFNDFLEPSATTVLNSLIKN